MYFHWVSTKLEANSNPTIIAEATIGPVLSYDVSKQTNNVLRAVEILISPPDNSKSSINPSVLDDIGNSLRFLQ